jgi:hypothetical protein
MMDDTDDGEPDAAAAAAAAADQREPRRLGAPPPKDASEPATEPALRRLRDAGLSSSVVSELQAVPADRAPPPQSQSRYEAEPPVLRELARKPPPASRDDDAAMMHFHESDALRAARTWTSDARHSDGAPPRWPST